MIRNVTLLLILIVSLSFAFSEDIILNCGVNTITTNNSGYSFDLPLSSISQKSNQTILDVSASSGYLRATPPFGYSLNTKSFLLSNHNPSLETEYCGDNSNRYVAIISNSLVKFYDNAGLSISNGILYEGTYINYPLNLEFLSESYNLNGAISTTQIPDADIQSIIKDTLDSIITNPFYFEMPWINKRTITKNSLNMSIYVYWSRDRYYFIVTNSDPPIVYKGKECETVAGSVKSGASSNYIGGGSFNGLKVSCEDGVLYYFSGNGKKEFPRKTGSKLYNANATFVNLANKSVIIPTIKSTVPVVTNPTSNVAFSKEAVLATLTNEVARNNVSTYYDTIYQTCNEVNPNLNCDYVIALIISESGFINIKSKSGADHGFMQMQDIACKEIYNRYYSNQEWSSYSKKCKDNPISNIDAGVRLYNLNYNTASSLLAKYSIYDEKAKIYFTRMIYGRPLIASYVAKEWALDREDIDLSIRNNINQYLYGENYSLARLIGEKYIYDMFYNYNRIISKDISRTASDSSVKSHMMGLVSTIS